MKFHSLLHSSNSSWYLPMGSSSVSLSMNWNPSLMTLRLGWLTGLAYKLVMLWGSHMVDTLSDGMGVFRVEARRVWGWQSSWQSRMRFCCKCLSLSTPLMLVGLNYLGLHWVPWLYLFCLVVMLNSRVIPHMYVVWWMGRVLQLRLSTTIVLSWLGIYLKVNSIQPIGFHVMRMLSVMHWLERLFRIKLGHLHVLKMLLFMWGLLRNWSLNFRNNLWLDLWLLCI